MTIIMLITIGFKPSSSISYGGKFLDEVFIYLANHIFNVGTSRDSIDRLIYKGSQNLGGDTIQSETFNDLDGHSFYYVLTSGGDGAIVD